MEAFVNLSSLPTTTWSLTFCPVSLPVSPLSLYCHHHGGRTGPKGVPSRDKVSQPSSDRNFDGIADTFERNIYGGFKGRLRLDIVNEDISAHVLFPTNTKVSIIDAGGGIGQFSSQLAAKYSENGAHEVEVTLCDISSEMLDRARQEFARICPECNATFLHCAGGHVHMRPDMCIVGRDRS